MTFETLEKSLPENYAPADVDLVHRAYSFALAAHDGQDRATGEAYIVHPLAVARVLAELGLDPATIAAGLLHDVVEDTTYGIEELSEEFGTEITGLVDGVTRLEQIDQFSHMPGGHPDAQAESLRKMFLAMVDDVRVILIRLADRLHNMRTLSALPEVKRKRIAQETLDIFAPLANRLGIWQIKWELEDLAFRHLEPETYKELAGRLDQRRDDREHFINQVVEQLMAELRLADISFQEITGRPKHIYSIWRKMRRKGVDFDSVYDVHGIRVIVPDTPSCYATLGIVHTLWKPIPREFDDYIATPKDNMYRSLHTVILGPGGRSLEVQIRTPEMHRHADLGVAAHWRYKEKTQRDVDFENKIAWLRQIMDWRQEVTDAREFVDSMQTDVFQDRVYIFTPRGDVIDLPTGATPIDFAYHVHTEIGNRCRGARVNGKLVALDYQLRNGDQVEILAAKRGGPSRDWLNPNMGYIRTSRARSKVRGWFRKQNRETNILHGREILERELKRLGLEKESYEDVAKLFDFDEVDDLLAAIGYGDLHAVQIAGKVSEKQRKEEEPSIPTEERPPLSFAAEGLKVRGVGDLLTSLAHCCHPLPGDDIIGYVTRGRGVTIHKKDCPNVIRMKDQERLIEVEWDATAQQTYPVGIRIDAYDRSGLLRDVANLVADEKVNLREATVTTGLKDNMAVITATLEIAGMHQLSRLLARIEQLSNVRAARRIVG